MRAAAAGHSTLGIPKDVGEEYSDADSGGKLPARKALVGGSWLGKDMVGIYGPLPTGETFGDMSAEGTRDGRLRKPLRPNDNGIQRIGAFEPGGGITVNGGGNISGVMKGDDDIDPRERHIHRTLGRPPLSHEHDESHPHDWTKIPVPNGPVEKRKPGDPFPDQNEHTHPRSGLSPQKHSHDGADQPHVHEPYGIQYGHGGASSGAVRKAGGHHFGESANALDGRTWTGDWLGKDAGGYETHDHSFISGSRSGHVKHSHDGPLYHEHPNTGPGAYTVDRDEWSEQTGGIKGGGKKHFTANPSGEQFAKSAPRDDPALRANLKQVAAVGRLDGGSAYALMNAGLAERGNALMPLRLTMAGNTMLASLSKSEAAVIVKAIAAFSEEVRKSKSWTGDWLGRADPQPSGVVACQHCGASSTPDIDKCPSCGRQKVSKGWGDDDEDQNEWVGGRPIGGVGHHLPTNDDLTRLHREMWAKDKLRTGDTALALHHLDAAHDRAPWSAHPLDERGRPRVSSEELHEAHRAEHR